MIQYFLFIFLAPCDTIIIVWIKKETNLFFKRDEAAISETVKKYGSFCHSIALNILSINVDADECVNDAYLQAWNSIPPQKPDKLGSWLGKVVRNIALDFWKKNHRKKRYAGGDITRETVYSTVYPYHPQIEVTKDGSYFVSQNWTTLVANNAKKVIMDTLDYDNFWNDKMYLVDKKTFEEQMAILISNIKQK